MEKRKTNNAHSNCKKKRIEDNNVNTNNLYYMPSVVLDKIATNLNAKDTLNMSRAVNVEYSEEYYWKKQTKELFSDSWYSTNIFWYFPKYERVYINSIFSLLKDIIRSKNWKRSIEKHIALIQKAKDDCNKETNSDDFYDPHNGCFLWLYDSSLSTPLKWLEKLKDMYTPAYIAYLYDYVKEKYVYSNIGNFKKDYYHCIGMCSCEYENVPPTLPFDRYDICNYDVNAHNTPLPILGDLPSDLVKNREKMLI